VFENKTVLITGGTGSWGNELTKQLLKKNPKELRIYSRGELQQVTMQRLFKNDKLRFIIGDIRDMKRLDEACKGVDYIFHLAALKHVPICEEQPYEAIKTNIEGTKNLIDAAINNNVKKVIDVSTDKAVDPLNLYGMTKAIGERLIIHANRRHDTKFVCIRGGNVMGTNGSVIPFFIDQINKEKRLTITDMEMTRYFLSLPQAIALLFKACEASYGGETFVMKMPSCKISDLASTLIDEYAPGEEIELAEIGKRPGEKLHEVLVSRYEAENTYIYDDHYYVIFPMIHIEGLNEFYDSTMQLQKIQFDEYSSNTNLMKKESIRDLLKTGGFLK
jgi:FlaA1/EpsC-like NDP-sugar epimerase